MKIDEQSDKKMFDFLKFKFMKRREQEKHDAECPAPLSSGKRLYTITASHLAGIETTQTKRYHMFDVDEERQFVYEAASDVEAVGKFMIDGHGIANWFVKSVSETDIHK